MKFKITTVDYKYCFRDKKKLEKLGIKFCSVSGKSVPQEKSYFKKIEKTFFIEIKNLGELMNLIADYGDIVLTKDKIIIYDYYLD